jgi:hypothetical protein
MCPVGNRTFLTSSTLLECVRLETGLNYFAHYLYNYRLETGSNYP